MTTKAYRLAKKQMKRRRLEWRKSYRRRIATWVCSGVHEWPWWLTRDYAMTNATGLRIPHIRNGVLVSDRKI